MNLYPYRFAPVYKPKIWGGRALERLFGRDLPSGQKIGESWELADLAEGVSVVANGPEAGTSLTELVGRLGPKLLGGAAPLENGRFPLLLKLLDANDILSLQVHPDADAARRIGPPAALKTECWYIVESRGGYILKGVAEGVTEGDFRETLAGGDDPEALRRLVRRYDVAGGDFHYLPAGTVHALGAGVVVAEIQTPSDTTYRVSDWGRGREIHVERSLECIHYEPPPEPPGAGGEVLVSTPYFEVALRTAAPGRADLPGGRCRAWMVQSGSATAACPAGSAELSTGDTVLLPAGLDAATVGVRDELRYLDVTIPPSA
jgi:mannose-6-phosphate isomerase